MTSEARPPIQTRALAKRFGSVRALDGMDLTVQAGEVHGFLGPNGAGKTTTLRILLGLIRRTGGEAYVLGRDPWLSEVEELCDRVTIIRRGVTVETGTLAELRRLSRTTFRVVTSGDLNALLNLPGVRTLPTEGETTVFEADADRVASVLPVLSHPR
jgi:ABC-type multidrug transport system ATPase subunit